MLQLMTVYGRVKGQVAVESAEEKFRAHAKSFPGTGFTSEDPRALASIFQEFKASIFTSTITPWL